MKGNVVRWTPFRELNQLQQEMNLENNALTLKGDRQFEGDSQKERFLRSERPYGPFSRSFSMPAGIDEANIKAEFKNGVLTVTLSKKEAAKPKRIQIAA